MLREDFWQQMEEAWHAVAAKEGERFGPTGEGNFSIVLDRRESHFLAEKHPGEEPDPRFHTLYASREGRLSSWPVETTKGYPDAFIKAGGHP